MPVVETDPVLSKELMRYPLASTFHIVFNLNREPFQDKLVREAFAYGFDRAAYCQEILFGSCTPTLSFIPPGVPGHIATDAYAFDPEQARRALAESAYGGPEHLPEIVWYYVADGREALRAAEWLTAQYRAVLGVQLTLVAVTTEEYTALEAAPEIRPQMLWWIWDQDYPDPQNWLSLLWTCGAPNGAGLIGYCNPAFDLLIARADAEPDPARRLALYEEAQRLLIADAPAVFLFNPIQNVLVKPHVVGYAVAPDASWPGWYTPLTIDIAPAA
jgi:oligopeptide transport system substrate-binding protein